MEKQSKTLAYKGRIVFQKLFVPNFRRLPKVYHENEACFVFVNQGKFNVRAQTQVLEVNTESALLAKCLNYFYETAKGNSTEDDNVEVVGIMLYPELVRDLFDYDVSKSKYTVDYNLKQVQVNQLLVHYRESVSILLDHPDLADEQLIKNKLREFIILITKTVDAPSESDFLAAMFKPTYERFEAIIHANIYTDLSLNEMAALCHMSLSTFKRRFQEVFEDSPVRYFTKMKINKAIEQLGKKGMRVSDIAYELGFESLTTFNRAFKRQTGQSPSQYRLD